MDGFACKKNCAYRKRLHLTEENKKRVLRKSIMESIMEWLFNASALTEEISQKDVEKELKNVEDILQMKKND